MPQRRAPTRIDSELIRQLVEAEPDILLVKLQQKTAQKGVRASTVHLWRILRNLGLRLKKSLHVTERDSEENFRRRQAHLETIAQNAPERLICGGKSGVSTQMTRLYGRASKGRRSSSATIPKGKVV